MNEKKDKGKFTIRFNEADAEHLAAIELLNKQGKKKAAYLTKAILHYHNEYENKYAWNSESSLDELTERICQKLISKNILLHENTSTASNDTYSTGNELAAMNTSDKLDTETLSMLTDAIDAFRTGN